MEYAAAAVRSNQTARGGGEDAKTDSRGTQTSTKLARRDIIGRTGCRVSHVHSCDGGGHVRRESGVASASVSGG